MPTTLDGTISFTVDADMTNYSTTCGYNGSAYRIENSKSITADTGIAHYNAKCGLDHGKGKKTSKCFDVDRIVFNDPATIIFWKDGTKTVVKCAEGTTFDKYAGFCASVTKRVYENNSLINKLVKNGFDEAPKHVKISRSKGLKDSKDKKNVKKEKKNG